VTNLFFNFLVVFSPGLWALVNNAGVPGTIAPIEWHSIQDFQEVLNINLLGTINVTQTFLPLIRKECGRIVNMASTLGRIALANHAPYSISKHGIEAFSDALR